MTLTYSENPDTKVVEMRVSGRIEKADFDSVIGKLQAFIDTHGTVKFIEVIDDFGGFDPSVMWPGMKFDFKNIPHISHVAVVSDIGWIGPISKAAGALMPTKLRTFHIAELQDARDWITSA